MHDSRRTRLVLGVLLIIAIALITLDFRDGGASPARNAGADIYGFALSKGLFGGIAIEGGVIHPRDRWASSYYGGRHTSASVVRRDGVANAGADALRKALGTL